MAVQIMTSLPDYIQVEPSEVENLPTTNLISNISNWLQFLSSTYSHFSPDTADPEVMTLVDTILSAVQSARSILHKTQYTTQQYCLLTNQITRLETRLKRSTAQSQGCHSISIWNQLQVYSHVQQMYLLNAKRLSVQLVEHWIAISNLHDEEFQDLHTMTE